ncbi:MAG: TIGR00730 family Rossman fold protein [Candidatus Paceibacterota bacterium]
MINKKPEIKNEKQNSLMLTREEILETAKSRVSLITREFQNGFDFISNYPKSVTIFGSNRVDKNNSYYKQSESIARRIAKDLGYAVLTGGGLGIMEGANKGAFEAGGQSLGLGIKLPHEQGLNAYLTDESNFYYFFSRKVCLSFSAEAFIFLPGGFGTLDEFFEILTLVQTRKIEKIPIILLGSDFWSKFDEIIKKEMISREFIDEEDTWLYVITDDEEDIIDIIKRAPTRNGIKFNYEKVLSELSQKKCVPCEGGTLPVDGKYAEEMVSKLPDWSLSKDYKKISLKKEFKDFTDALFFINQIGDVAEKEGHHPDICLLNYKNVEVTLTTHDIGGLSENDFIVASKISDIQI